MLSPEEEEAWKEQDEDERETDFLPKKHDALRQVATYPEALRERFYRCLDLYMAPRQIKMRMNVNPEKLLPKLPSAKGDFLSFPHVSFEFCLTFLLKELRPFPTGISVEYLGHTDLIRSLDLSPDSQVSFHVCFVFHTRFCSSFLV